MNPLSGKKAISITVGGVIAAITAAVQYPPVMAYIQSLLAAHPQIWSALGGIAGILMIFHDPNVGHTS